MEAQERFEGGQLYRAAWVFYLLLATAGIVWVGLREGPIPVELFFDSSRWWIDLALGVLVGALLIAFSWGAETVVPAARGLRDMLVARLGRLPSDEILGIAVLSGFAEELFFRGAVQGSLGLLWATLLFAVLHAGPGRGMVAWALFAAVAGLAFGGIMEWTGNLLAPITAHMLVNAVGLWRLGRLAEEGVSPEGAAEFPEAGPSETEPSDTEPSERAPSESGKEGENTTLRQGDADDRDP